MDLERPLTFLDFEATSTEPSQARIFQASILRVGKEKETWYTHLFDPWENIPDQIEELTGISEEDVMDKPTFNEEAENVVSLVEGADLCGHNLEEYDLPLLKKELRRTGHEMPSHGVVLDTLQLHRELASGKLEFLAEALLGIDPDDMHDARKDVTVTRRLLRKQEDLFDLSDTPEEIVENDLTTYIDEGEKFELQDDGTVVFCFGKHYDHTLEEVAENNHEYIDWMLSEGQYDSLGTHIEPHLQKIS